MKTNTDALVSPTTLDAHITAALRSPTRGGVRKAGGQGKRPVHVLTPLQEKSALPLIFGSPEDDGKAASASLEQGKDMFELKSALSADQLKQSRAEWWPHALRQKQARAPLQPQPVRRKMLGRAVGPDGSIVQPVGAKVPPARRVLGFKLPDSQ